MTQNNENHPENGDTSPGGEQSYSPGETNQHPSQQQPTQAYPQQGPSNWGQSNQQPSYASNYGSAQTNQTGGQYTQAGGQYAQPGGQYGAGGGYGQNNYAQFGYGQPGPYAQKPEKKSNTGMIIGIVVAAVVLVAVVIGVIFMMNRDKGDEPTPTPPTAQVTERAEPTPTPEPTKTVEPTREPTAEPTTDSPTFFPSASGSFPSTYDNARMRDFWNNVLPALYLASGDPSLDTGARPELAKCMADNTTGKMSDFFVDALEKSFTGDTSAMENQEYNDTQAGYDGLAMLSAMQNCGVSFDSLAGMGID